MPLPDRTREALRAYAVEADVDGRAAAPVVHGQAGGHGFGDGRFVGAAGGEADAAAGIVDAHPVERAEHFGADNGLDGGVEFGAGLAGLLGEGRGVGRGGGGFGAGEGAEMAEGHGDVEGGVLDVLGLGDELVGDARVAGDLGVDVVGVFAEGRLDRAVGEGGDGGGDEPALARGGVDERA